MGFLDRIRRPVRRAKDERQPTTDLQSYWLNASAHRPAHQRNPDRLAKRVRPELERLAGGADRIAVVDCETTGVYKSDRVVEVAIVTLGLDGGILDCWGTLIHPERDVSASSIHGLTAAILRDAPAFSEVAGDVAVRLDGACIAAHNLPFDARMLSNEFARIGLDVAITSGVDTLVATRSRLSAACARYGIELSHPHTALGDAMAAATLLRRVAAACHAGRPIAVPTPHAPSGRVLRRIDVTPVVLPDAPHLAVLLASLDYSDIDARMLSYLEVLGRAIADLQINEAERAELDEVAAHLGLDAAHRALANRRLVNDLIDAALADDVVTEAELDRLLRVATALEVDVSLVDRRTRSARSTSVTLRLQPGLNVVFTGDDPERPRDHLRARAESLGLIVQPGVNKRTQLLVAYDVESTSGKAAKANTYGIPIVSTEAFAGAEDGSELPCIRSHGGRKVVVCPDCHASWTVDVQTRARRSQRCADCESIPGRTSRAGSAIQPAIPQTPTIERLRCLSCGRMWAREPTRGRKPQRCPECRPR